MSSSAAFCCTPSRTVSIASATMASSPMVDRSGHLARCRQLLDAHVMGAAPEPADNRTKGDYSFQAPLFPHPYARVRVRAREGVTRNVGLVGHAASGKSYAVRSVSGATSFHRTVSMVLPSFGASGQRYPSRMFTG